MIEDKSEANIVVRKLFTCLGLSLGCRTAAAKSQRAKRVADSSHAPDTPKQAHPKE
jgi:hypothetical protein